MSDDEVAIRIRLLDEERAAHGFKDLGDHVGALGKKVDGAGKGFGRLGRVTASTSRGLSLSAGAALGTGAALTGGLVYGLKKSSDAYQETFKVGAQTTAVLKSTGGVANISAQGVGDLATALSKKTGVDDEAIQSGENMLLTFRGIRNEAGKGNDIFNQTTKASLDMSAAMGTDARSSALQLGKALNDPSKGYTRLQKSGVTFTDQQVKQIKTMQQSGDTLGAQKVILAELSKEFSGSAAAQGTATEKLSVSWGNVEEAIGKAEQPLLNWGAKGLTRITDELEPAVTHLGTRLDDVWSNKKLGNNRKLQLTVAATRNAAAPFTDEIKREFKQLDVGNELIAGFDKAAPVMADHAGQLGVQVLQGFGHTFMQTGWWGKLAIGVLAYAKFPAAFNAVGRTAGRRFASGYRGSSTTALAAAGKAGGITAAANTAEGLATQLPASTASRKGRITAAGRSIGLGFGSAAGSAAAGLITGRILQDLGSGDFLSAAKHALDPITGLGGSGGQVTKPPSGKGGINPGGKFGGSKGFGGGASIKPGDVPAGAYVAPWGSRHKVPQKPRPARTTGPGAINGHTPVIPGPLTTGSLSGSAFPLPSGSISRSLAGMRWSASDAGGPVRTRVQREQPINLSLDGHIVASVVTRSDEDWDERK